MDDVVAKGRNAWRRIEAREAATYDDWIAVGRALVAGRAVAMAKAKCNAPVGGAYNKAYGRFLQEAGFASVIAPERYKIIKVVENIAAVARWRESLSPAERRRCNHPSTLWIGWKRSAAFGGRLGNASRAMRRSRSRAATAPEAERSAPEARELAATTTARTRGRFSGAARPSGARRMPSAKATARTSS